MPPTSTLPAFSEIRYPRRRLIRGLLKTGIRIALAVLTDFDMEGEENIPSSGPLIVVANHFSHIDPAVMIHVIPRPIEFVGGFRAPGATRLATVFPKLWGVFPVFRGTASTYALKAALSVLNQDGVLGIFPEGGAWATVLRPARPGAAYLAARSGAQIVPVGFDGITEIFPSLKQNRRRTKVLANIGRPFGPFQITGRGRERREQLDEIGAEIMLHIRDLLPPERHGYFSDNLAIREAAKGTEIYPFAHASEFDFQTGDFFKE